MLPMPGCSMLRTLSSSGSRVQRLSGALSAYSHTGLQTSATVCSASKRRSTSLIEAGNIQSRLFHASRPNHGLHLVPVLATLKSTVVFSGLKTVTRIALTLLPIMLMRKHMGHKWLRKLEGKENVWEELGIKRADVVKMKKRAGYVSLFLALVPFAGFGLVILASMERTPITGRLRLIVISPDEEEGIVHDLRGPRWFKAVRDLLTTADGPPRFISASDWRYAWAERVLRRLEAVVPVLENRELMRDIWLSRGPHDAPFPPPPDYPLQPRPRASLLLHYFDPPGVEKTQSEHNKKHTILDRPPHSALGPPYSLLIADNQHQNAFSYGFGEGSGGLVIFSGFFEEILRQTESIIPQTQPAETSSFFSSLRRAFYPAPPSPDPVPTAEQDAQLAILIAHELSHLLLSHHLETLSSTSYFWPSLVSVVTDILRAITFPITMVGGPFINDALKQLGEIGTREFTTCVDSCASYHTEVEADLVSIRLLALAGWDPRLAIAYWESRLKDVPERVRQEAANGPIPGVMPGSLWDGEASHPVHGIRVKKMRKEIDRWEREKRRVLKYRKVSSSA